MNNISLNEEIEYKIGSKNYKFCLNNRALVKIDRKYKENGYTKMFNQMLKGEAFWDNAVKFLTCCTTEKLTEDEIIDNSTRKQFTGLNNLVNKLINNYYDFNEEEKEEKEEKNL